MRAKSVHARRHCLCGGRAFRVCFFAGEARKKIFLMQMPNPSFRCRKVKKSKIKKEKTKKFRRMFSPYEQSKEMHIVAFDRKLRKN
jgi:hypothetical protein